MSYSSQRRRRRRAVELDSESEPEDDDTWVTVRTVVTLPILTSASNPRTSSSSKRAVPRRPAPAPAPAPATPAATVFHDTFQDIRVDDPAIWTEAVGLALSRALARAIWGGPDLDSPADRALWATLLALPDDRVDQLLMHTYCPVTP